MIETQAGDLPDPGRQSRGLRDELTQLAGVLAAMRLRREFLWIQ
jgi:hypothetical protein